MAKIGALPGRAIVDAFRGKLDYYVWCNLNIVRSWPRSPGRNRAPAVVASQQPFAYINKLASTLPADVIEPYKAMALGSGLTWKDYLNRLYINASIRDHMHPSEVMVEVEMNMIWNDTAPQIINISNHNASIAWTDVDLTALTSANAKFAMIAVEFLVGVLGTTAWTVLAMRKKGTTASAPRWGMHPNEIDSHKVNDHFILALDTSQTMQYSLTLPADASGAYIWAYLLGYIE